MTVRDLIRRSLRLIGAIAVGEDPAADEAQDALSSLRGMLGSWSTDRLNLYYVTREEFTLSGSMPYRTIGPGGTFNTARPTRIREASYITDGIETPIKILNTQRWSDVDLKGLQSDYPQALYYEPQYPLGRVYLYPNPVSAIKLVLYSDKPLDFVTLNDPVELPPGYEEAIVYNLAIRLAPEYGRAIPGEVVSVASESKAAIQRLNNQPAYMTSDIFGLVGPQKTFDWRTGE